MSGSQFCGTFFIVFICIIARLVNAEDVSSNISQQQNPRGSGAPCQWLPNLNGQKNFEDRHVSTASSASVSQAKRKSCERNQNANLQSPTNTVLFKFDKTTGYEVDNFLPSQACGAYYTAVWYCSGVPDKDYIEKNGIEACVKNTDWTCKPCKNVIKDVKPSYGFYASIQNDPLLNKSGHFFSDKIHYKLNTAGNPWSKKHLTPLHASIDYVIYEISLLINCI